MAGFPAYPRTRREPPARPGARVSGLQVAKDTEKLIRQLSLISFLMAERRPVSALEIRQDVEGYAQMTATRPSTGASTPTAPSCPRSGIELKVEKPSEGSYEAENYTLPPENFYLPAIEFSDAELGALRTALHAARRRVRLRRAAAAGAAAALVGQALAARRRPSSSSVALAITDRRPGGRELSQRLSKIETAIFRRKTIVFDYYTIGRDAEEKRKVDPYHLLFRGGQFYLVGHSHEREDVRVFRLSRIRGKVGYSSKAEHDFQRPEDFDPRAYATRTDWQLGEQQGVARIWLSDRIEWLVRRHLGPDAGTVERGRRRRDLRDRLRRARAS